jgi:hypothetical protein
MCGPLDANPSSTIIIFNLGCSFRNCVNNRLPALRSQSFFLIPSCFIIGSGAKGKT